MTVLLLAIPFLLIMTGITAGGYWLLQRRRTDPGPASLMTATFEEQSVLVETLRTIGEILPPSPTKSDPTRERLAQAGYRGPHATAVFQGVKAALAIVPALAVAMYIWIGQAVVITALLGGLAVAGIGYLLPERILTSRIMGRRRRLRRGLPAVMDLLILAIEAGQSLDQACFEVGRQLSRCYVELAQEFGLMHLELRAGSSRAAALANLAARNGEPELRKLTNLLLAGERFGSQLAPTLRTQAKYLRIRMRQEVQETARKIGVKMVFPLVLLIFPSLLLVTLGPAVLRMMESMEYLFGG